MTTTLFIVLLFLLILGLNTITSLKGHWAFFYDTQLFRKFFPFEEGFTIKHPHNDINDLPDISLTGFDDYKDSWFKKTFKNTKSSYNKGIETFSLCKGSKNCPDYGYTNCEGNLCLSTDDIKMLKTRGGNDSNSANYT